ncbi:MAG TPA: Sec-independent protein translocase protein TatB [Gammaproteobacteria bacterium]
MFDVGFSELALIGVLALIIAGPERLPGIMRTLGRFAGRAKASVAAIRDELEREVDEVSKSGAKESEKNSEENASEENPEAKSRAETKRNDGQ